MKTFLKFSLAGFVGFISDYLAFQLLSHLISLHVARPVCFFLAVNVTFIINKNFAFKGYKARYRWYVAGQMKALVINFVAFELLLLVLGRYTFGEDIAFVLAALAILLYNFTWSRFIAFKRS